MAGLWEVLADITTLKKGKCVYCRRDIPDDGEICADCMRKQEKLQNKSGFYGNSMYVYQYDGIVRRLIHNYKYNDMPYLCVYMAEKMFIYLKQWNVDADMIAYVPISKARLASRGFDQAELLAEHLGTWSGLQVEKLLVRIKNTQPQYNLSREQRKKNMKGAFRLEGKHQIQGKRILLIDDILTTCATMGECAGLLEKAGATVIPFAFARENLFD